MKTIQQQARSAGILYLLLGLTAPVGLLYVPSQIFVAGDAAATAENLRLSEGLLRLGIASELIHQTIVVFLVLALYRLFAPVDRMLARQVVVLGALLSVPIMFLNIGNELAAQVFASRPDFLSAFDAAQLDGLAYLFLDLHGDGITIASVFWGLWLFPFGLLVIRSGFIPRFLGVLMIVAGAAYVVAAFTALVLPQHMPLVGKIALPLEMGEIPIIFWLLIWGARPGDAESPPV